MEDRGGSGEIGTISMKMVIDTSDIDVATEKMEKLIQKMKEAESMQVSSNE